MCKNRVISYPKNQSRLPKHETQNNDLLTVQIEFLELTKQLKQRTTFPIDNLTENFQPFCAIPSKN